MDLDKMKALALAATEGGGYFEMQSKLIDFQFEASPWAVLELIAEVERLRAAANVRETPWYLAACRMGNTLYNISQHDDLPANWRATCRGMVDGWDEARKGIGAATAPGTAKDAARYRPLTRTDVIQLDDEFLADDCVAWVADPHGIFVGMEYGPDTFRPARRKIAAIGAHTKAGKDR
jgi:hypothetical protein